MNLDINGVEFGSKMVGLNLLFDHLIEGNFPKLKNWAQVKCSPVIHFKEFSKISEKMELHNLRWKYPPQKNY